MPSDWLQKQPLEAVNIKKNEVIEICQILQNFSVDPKDAEDLLSEKKMSPLLQKQKASALLLRPNLALYDLMEGIPALIRQTPGISIPMLSSRQKSRLNMRLISKKKKNW